jgi:hypothetical protein
LGIEAPKSIPVHRKEVYDKIIEINRLAAKTEIEKLKDAMKNNPVKINKNIKDNLSNQTIVSSKEKENSEKNKEGE